MTPGDEAAVSLHEWFVSLTQPGRFTRLEACVIIGTMLAQQAGGAGRTDG